MHAMGDLGMKGWARTLWALSVLVGLLPQPAQAQSVFVTGKVSRIFPAGDSSIHFRFKSDTCNAGNAYYSIAVNHPSLKNWYAMLLAAAEADASVTIAIPQTPACGTADNKPINYLFRDY
jgi:hypothetical protein